MDVHLSVIICTYKRADLLKKCLESLCGQIGDSLAYEVLVVDNNSLDDTRAVVLASQQEAKFPLRYILEENVGLSHARNRGCAEARGQMLIYLDDDVIVPTNYLSNVSKVILTHQPDIMGGPVYPFYLSKKPYWFHDDLETKKYAESSGFSTTCSVTGCNYIIRKTVLEQLGLFDIRFGMQGDSIGMLEERKLLEEYRVAFPTTRQKVYYAVECYVYHYVPEKKMRLTYIIKRNFVAGYAAYQMNSGLKKRFYTFWGYLAILRGVWKFLTYPFLGIRNTAIMVKFVVDMIWGLGYIASQTANLLNISKTSKSY